MDELTVMKIFSKNLKRIMEEDKITQKELADDIGVSQQVISKYIRGESIPSLTIAINIADVLFCSIEDLIKEV